MGRKFRRREKYMREVAQGTHLSQRPAEISTRPPLLRHLNPIQLLGKAAGWQEKVRASARTWSPFCKELPGGI
jgi:hypothetical protein